MALQDCKLASLAIRKKSNFNRFSSSIFNKLRFYLPYRFVPPTNLFGTPQENPDNACFCNNPNGICDTPSGVFNVSACQYGSPTLLSWPHFFQADPSLRAAVNGMKPNKDKHQFYIDVQPVNQKSHWDKNTQIIQKFTFSKSHF